MTKYDDLPPEVAIGICKPYHPNSMAYVGIPNLESNIFFSNPEILTFFLKQKCKKCRNALTYVHEGFLDNEDGLDGFTNFPTHTTCEKCKTKQEIKK